MSADEGTYVTFQCCTDPGDSLTVYLDKQDHVIDTGEPAMDLGADEGASTCVVIECSQDARHAYVRLTNDDARDLARRILGRVSEALGIEETES